MRQVGVVDSSMSDGFASFRTRNKLSFSCVLSDPKPEADEALFTLKRLEGAKKLAPRLKKRLETNIVKQFVFKVRKQDDDGDKHETVSPTSN